MGMGGRKMGTGPPYLKVAAPASRVAVSLGSVEPVERPLTLAAQTIARRGGLMGQAIQRSHPRLVRPQRERPVPLNSTERDEEALKLETYLVNLNVSVTDRVGKFIPGLKQEDFTIYEEGVAQRISFFSPEQAPFNLVLLLDLSGSMRDEIDLIKETATHFLDVISPQDSIAVVTFSTDVTIVSRLTRDREDLRESIDLMLAPTGGTAFYDALGYALAEILRRVKGQRNAVIAITDGEDNALQAQVMKSVYASALPRPPYSPPLPPGIGGSVLTFESLLDGVKEADAIIYPIHLNPVGPTVVMPFPPTKGSAEQARTNRQVQSELTEVARKQLRSLAEASGGRFYHANKIEDLAGVFDQVAAELRTLYSMAYTPADINFDGRFRRIRVQVNRVDAAVRTRPGYYGR
jgi:VWFA-related protein